MDPVRISVVIVTWNSRDALGQTLPALLAELADQDELIVVDNASSDGSAQLATELAPGATVIETGSNLGFAAGANRGADAASRELIVLLNPDATVAPGWRDALVEPARTDLGLDAWQALVTMDHGELVNTSGGVVHYTGLAWAGGAGSPAASVGPEPKEVAFASGACLAIPATRWRELGGMPDSYFLYFEDVDLSLRLRLEGGHVGVVPRARVEHSYEFHKGALKWRMLERGRWATLIRTFPGPLLLLVAPALAATELALLVVAFGSGWGRQKLLAVADTFRALPRLLRERREVQRRRVVSSAEYAKHLTADLDSPYLGRAGRSATLRAVLRLYWRLVVALLRR